MTKVLIVDDDAAFTMATAELIEHHGFEAVTASTLAEARRLLKAAWPTIILLDVMLPDGSGLDLLGEADLSRQRIIVMTAYPTVDVAVDSLRARVSDFLVKPVDPKGLLASLEALRRAQARAQPIVAAERAIPAFAEFIGNSRPMLELYRLIDRVAPSRASVFVRGASGTGKELVAQAIHASSERREQAFLSLNCGAVATELIGSELFGHERGSFTGASRQHQGYFERADGGTLFLDEITEMPMSQQVQLLRVLETGELMRVGGDRVIPVDVRIVAATNRDPRDAIGSGKLREDLYYRLAVFPIDMPALDQRSGDIRLLAEHFLRVNNAQEGGEKRFAAGVLTALERRRWPGHVRELKNAVQRAYILAESELEEAHFAETSSLSGGVNVNDGGSPALSGAGGGAPLALRELERQTIVTTLAHYNGNKPKAADALGISLKTLYNRLNQYEDDATN